MSELREMSGGLRELDAAEMALVEGGLDISAAWKQVKRVAKYVFGAIATAIVTNQVRDRI